MLKKKHVSNQSSAWGILWGLIGAELGLWVPLEQGKGRLGDYIGVKEGEECFGWR